MPFTMTMPKLSPTMEEGAITKWRFQVGDYVKSGDVLIEVATDKATVEHSALDEGYLREILVSEGQTARVNQPIAIFSESLEDNIEAYIPKEPQRSAPSAPASSDQKEESIEVIQNLNPTSGSIQEPAFVPFPPLAKANKRERGKTVQGRILASPLARRLAEEKGIDLSSLKGSGPKGRIMSRDLDVGLEEAVVSFSKKSIPETPPGFYEEEPLSSMRKVIGKRLQEAKTFIPHFYVSQELNAIPMVLLRQQLKSGGVKITYNDLILRATALSLRKHPQLNSGFNSVNSTLIRFKTIDIAVGVSISDGLITPIIRYADYKDLGEISVEVKLLAKKAREGKLAPEEFMGGSFTLSNLGMYGVSHFIPVINPPQAAILAVGGIQEKAVVENGQIVPGKTITLTVAADHRVVDGVHVAEFLQTLQMFLENPALLLV